MTHERLAQALLAAVRAQDFGATPDARRGGRPLADFPSLDLAVVAFPPAAPPVWADVLFSREFPQGLVADISADAGTLRNIAFVADVRDAEGVSIAWLPGADWSRIDWQPLQGSGPHRFVAPYPASLLKLMVGVGVAIAVDAGVLRWDQPWTHAGRTRTVDAWCVDMITISCNESTTAMVALLHAARMLGPGRNVLHARFEAVGLRTLRLDGTRQDGGWGNAAGAGVGRIQMTAWDTVRLLWTLDPLAAAPTWPGGQPLLSIGARDQVLGWLRAQRLHHVLGRPADAAFAHKTGTTENYGADAGVVQARAPQRRHYLIALLSNLGSRYAPGEPEGTTPARLRALGAAVDGVMRTWMEDDAA
jgi:Beta-lactamase enzyme family